MKFNTALVLSVAALFSASAAPLNSEVASEVQHLSERGLRCCRPARSGEYCGGTGCCEWQKCIRWGGPVQCGSEVCCLKYNC
ncbi:hypothetical protein BGZ82_002627 [Podila clonocystis]|nr:hypothetical protein BGZ82_002627 [Podila clonocystis]